MLSFLSQLLDPKHETPLRLLGYLTVRTMLATVLAFAIGLIVGPRLIRKFRELKFGQTYADDRVGDVAARFDKKHTPPMGGLIIFVAVLVSVLVCAEFNVWVRVSIFVYTALTVAGWRDDYLKVARQNRDGISSWEKILWQSTAALGALGWLMVDPLSSGKIRELWMPFVNHPVVAPMSVVLLLGLFYLWIVGFSNAINLTDGLDGLAGGCTVSVALAFGIMAYLADNVKATAYLGISHVPGTGELAVLCGALIGGCLAFLWYNAHPAEVFMGDTGSLALGGLIGVMAFMIHQPFTLVIVGGVFVVEALSVMVQVGWFKWTKRRYGAGRRVFRMAPLHHHFQKLGWPETKVVFRFWILSLMCALAGLGTLKLR
jgi:phospho-N-acetylmuramoyl-pentapeptide-transferase